MISHEVDALPVVKPVNNEDGTQMFEVIGRIIKSNITRLFVELGEGNF